MMHGVATVALIATLSLSSRAAAQSWPPRGRVVSSAGRGIVGADVRIGTLDRSVGTDDDGWFVWPGLSQGTWAVDVRAVGYLPRTFSVTVSATGLVPGCLELVEAAQRLPTVFVTESAAVAPRLVEFERRRKVGSGRFFTRADVARTQATTVSGLMRMLPAGVRVLDSLGTPLAVSARGRKLVSDGQFFVVPCVLRVAIDGVVQPWGTSLDVIVPAEVIGIEVYLGPASVPAEFAALQRDGFCGLLMFWTGGGG